MEILVFLADGRLEGFLLFRRPAFAFAFVDLGADLCQYAGGLFRTHDRRSTGWPGKHRIWLERAAQHRQIPGPIGSAGDDGEFRHPCRGHRGDHLCTGLGDAHLLDLAAHHKAVHIRQKQKRNIALDAEVDEMGGLQRSLDEQHAGIGDNADFVAVDAAPAGHDRVTVQRLEFVEIAVIHQTRDDFAVLGRHLGIAADDAVDFLGRVSRRTRFGGCLAGQGLFAQVADDIAGDRQRMRVILGQMVGYAGDGGVHLAAAQFFGFDLFTGCGKG